MGSGLSKNLSKKNNGKENSQPRPQEATSNPTNPATVTSDGAVGSQPPTTVSTAEQSNASQRTATGKGAGAGEKDKIGVNILCPGNNPVVDIVFLHGLTGKRDSTWTSAGSEKSWPEVLLGEDMKQARIITYGYDADVVHLIKPASQATVREHSGNVLLDLKNLRIKEPSTKGRPIIFVVHSLGGLVIQDAIVYSRNHPDVDCVDISISTRGIIFLGTPHAGSDFTKFAEALANLIRLSVIKKPNRSLLKVLRGNSAMLANIENDFMGLLRVRTRDKLKEIDLFVFVEEDPVAATGHRVVASESAKIKGYPFATINADHMGMTKFASKNADYGRVLGVLEGWVNSLEPMPVQDETSRSDPNAPNDENFGREVYFCNKRSIVKYYTRRSHLLETIHSQFKVREENRSTVVILQALGGQGKSQLAIDYCYQNWKQRKYHAVVFLNASSEQTLRGEFISLIDVLKSPAQTFENDDQKFTFVLSKIKSWNRSWLLVLDNYDNPQTFPNIDRDYIPHTNHGNILVTTRYHGLDELGKPITIPPMSQEEAADLLIKASGISDRTNRTHNELSTHEHESAVDIVNLLGCLPLAVHQAAAYIRYKELELADFMEDYNAHKTVILKRQPALWDYGQTVYTTWELSYGLIDVEEQSRQRKGALLTMLAFLDYRSISRELFDVPRGIQNLEADRGPILELIDPLWLREILRRDGNWDILQVEDRLDLFRDLSLLQILDRSKRKAYKISFHPLVADWVRYRVHSDQLTERQCLFQASVLVLACLKDQVRPEIASLLSEQAREEVMRHQSACLIMLNKLRKEDSSSPFALAIQMVLTEIQQLPKLIQESRDKRSAQHTRNVLQWLSPHSQRELYHQYQSSRVPGTCDWINHKDAFVQWEAGQASILLIGGQPGSGKSVLISSIVEKLLHRVKRSDAGLEAVAFCFVQFHDLGAWSATRVLRTLLQQIVNGLQRIPSTVGKMFERATTHGDEPSIVELQNALTQTVKDFEKVWILVDALDELGDDRASLIKSLVELVTQASPKQNFHIAFASRDISYHVEEVISSFKWIRTERIDITPDQVEDDIRKFVSAFTEKRSTGEHAGKHLSASDARLLVHKANGSFLWARLFMEEFVSYPDRAYAVLHQQSSPETSPLYRVYKQKLAVKGSHGWALVHCTLAFICLAIRPVTSLEVQYAVAALAPYSTLVSISKDHANTLLDIETIIEQCHGLVSLDTQTGVLAVSHQSVRDWYLETYRYIYTDSDIASICLTHFFRGQDVRMNLQDQFLTYPLLSYAARYWVHHLARAPDEGTILKFLYHPFAVEHWLKVLQADKVARVEKGNASVSVVELLEILPGLMKSEKESMVAFAKKLGFQLDHI